MTPPLARVLSPAGRIASALVLASAIATMPNARERHAALAVAALAALLFALGRPRVGWLLRRALPALLFTAALLVPFLLAGQRERAHEIALRATAAVSVVLLVASTLSLAELPTALFSLGVPRSLAGTVHALLWQLEHVGDQGRRLLLARRLRGARGAFGPEMLSALLWRTADRAERVELAMALRHADPLGRRRPLGASDFAAIVLCLAFGIALHRIAGA